MESMIREDPSIKISLIQERINSEFSYKVSYRKAWMAKQKAIAIEYGDWEESYAKLSSWLTHMQNHSPGSYFQILHDDFIVGNRVSREHRQFHRVFWTFGQCKEAFKYCKSIIQVDGTHLYGKYRGTLLMATLQDGNGGVLPLAFAVVKGETLTAWSWFLAHLREHVTDKNEICLISDRHASIKSDVANEALAYTPCKHVFDQNLEKFRQLSPAIARWIDRISKEKWSMAYDTSGRRYGHMTTNLSECVNKVLKDCRSIPITALVKSTYSRCRKYFVDRGRQAQRQLREGQVYCSKLVTELRKNQEQACSHIVRVYDIHSTRFEVEETFNPITQRGGQKWAVNLNGHYCQCGSYSALHYPCSHIIAACGYVSMNYYQYIDVVYTNEHILKAYSAQWWPLGNEAAIPPSDEAWTLIPDPTTIRAKGRPKSTRIRNEMDWVEPSDHRQKCSRCGAEGHNRRRCPMQSDRGRVLFGAKLHRIQHCVCVLLVFLIHFSSLQFPSHGYTVPDKYFNNCGSDSSVSKSGKNYVGESNLKTSFGSSNTERSESQVPSPLYQTAKKFRIQHQRGTYLVRLHFFAFSSPSNLSSASFNVSVPGFWLLRNFNGRNDSHNNSAVVKEFFMQITSGSFKITFRPLPSSFAFVNAIELFILPIHLTANQVSRFTYSGNTSLDPLSGGLVNDSLLRKWNPDDSYILNTENAKNRSPYLGPIQYRVGNDSDGSNANEYTAPSDVYGTAKEINSSSSSAGNITWALLVDNNADHLLRLHFCDYWSPQNDLKYFDLSIYDTYVMSVNIDNQELPAPYYYDFVVHSDDSGFMKVSIAPDASAPIPNAFLNGLEIMKVIRTSSSVPLDQEPYSNHNSLPVVLGSVIGGLVVVFAVVILGFLWRFKMRKEKPVENSDWLPIPITAGGSSHGRLTDGTSHGSPLPNISLRLKSPLIDLQLATKNFHASQLIGKGGFGNVYKGVLRNGIIFAVKRSQPGSGQGLPEFQTEI
ncbi:putative receptor-like protein kinase [Glycine soja]